jgi:mannose-6-phosphate isomerase-like protein (cupin superfamily)
MDGPAPNAMSVPFWPGLAMTSLWMTNEVPVINTGSDDASSQPVGHDPTPNGTIFRFYEFPPDTAMPKDCGKLLGLTGATEEDWNTIHPMMHATSSIDYLIVISGEMTMIMEDRTEVVLRPGDCVVQRGTKHAWSNRGTTPVLLFAVLVDGTLAGKTQKP